MNDKLKDQALKYCIEIYKDYTREDIHRFSGNMIRAWKVGKRADSLHNQKVKPKQAESKKCSYCVDFHKGGMLCLRCGTYPPEG